MDVRSLARSRDEDGRPRAESCPSPEGEIYKQESFFNADDYAYRAAYHERRRKHHQSERNYYLGQGRNRFGVEVRRAYKQLSLLPSLSSRIEVVPPEEAIATPW